MKPLIVFSDVTVDGFMAGPDNDLDFLVDDPRLEDELTGELMSVADTIVFGRKSFPDSAAYWTATDGDLTAWMNATPKVVLSTDSNFDVGAWENSTLAAGDGVDEVRRLKESSGGAVVAFGGAHRSLARRRGPRRRVLAEVQSHDRRSRRVDVLRRNRTQSTDLAQREILPVGHHRRELLDDVIPAAGNRPSSSDGRGRGALPRQHRAPSD